MSSKIHWRSVRLYVNAGLSYPLCMENDRRLNTQTKAKTTPFETEVTCQHCRKALNQYRKLIGKPPVVWEE
jgi:hypothetical protein